MRSLLTILLLCTCFSAFSQTIVAPMHWKKGLFDTLSVAGGLKHQLLGAKSDNGRLEYLEPLVQGAFVVSDSELNATTLVPAIYDLRNGQKWVSDNAGIFAKDTTGASYFTDYGVRRFLYNPTTNKTFYVNGDSSWAQIGSGNVFNVHADTTIQNTYVTNDNNYYYSLSDSSWLDSRDFYNDGTITSPYRIRRYDNAYIDSLFASIQPGGGGGGTTVNNYYGSNLPYNGDTSYYLAGDSVLHKLPVGVLDIPKYNLPYNADSSYYLAGDSILHKLPVFDSGSLSKRIDAKLNITDTAGKWLPIGTKFASPLVLTTNGQNGASTLRNDTLNVPNYFFATNAGDSIDYSLSAMTTIYNEKGPGEYLTSGHGVTANPDNFNFPFKQLKALDVSGWSAGDYVSFKNATTANSTAYTFIRAFIRLKQAVPVIQSLSFQFYLNGTAVSKIISMVNYGLDKSMVDKYQNISIPMSAFGFTDNNFDEIRLIFGGGSSPDGLYLDLFQFQNATTTENKYVTDVFRIPGTTTVQKVLGGQNSFAFDDSVGAAVDTTSLSKRIDDKLNSRDTANKWMPRNTSIVTAFNGRAGNVLPQSADYAPYYIPLNFGTQGSVLFRGATGISEDNGHFRYDSSTGRLSVGTTSGTYKVNILTNANVEDGLIVTNTNTGSGAAADIFVKNAEGTLGGLSIATTNFFNTPAGALNNRMGLVSTKGLSIISNSPNTTLGTDDIRFYPGGVYDAQGQMIPKMSIKPNGGFVITPITKAQRDAIANPEQGRVVFVADNGGYLSYYNNGSWMKISAQFD